MNIFYPSKLIHYFSKEFIFSLLLVFLVFLSLSLLINSVGELVYLKDKKLENIIWMATVLTLAKTPTTIIELSIFIFLFSGILFFVKIQKNNEVNTMLLAGISKTLPILIPSIISFICGLFIIFFLTSISSASLNFYEQEKRIYSSNDNLIVMNKMGLWFMENTTSGYNIIRADKIEKNNFNILNNVTIYNLDQGFNFVKRYDSEKITINQKRWSLNKTQVTQEKKSLSDSKKDNDASLVEMSFDSSININDLKNYFSDE